MFYQTLVNYICFQYINKKPKTLLNGGVMIPFHSFKPEIEFKDITFAYPTRPEQVKKWRHIFLNI
jgi:hypothetical protein